METEKEVGKKFGKSYGHTKFRSDGMLVGCVDGITFGVDEAGQTFHTALIKDWSKEDKIRWAKAGVQFFQDIVDKLDRWAKIVEEKE